MGIDDFARKGPQGRPLTTDPGTNFAAIIETYGLSVAEAARRFNIPYQSVQNWYHGRSKCPPYVLGMMEEILLLTMQPK